MTNIYIIGYIKWFDSGFITDDKQSQQHLFGHAFYIFYSFGRKSQLQ